MIGRLALGVVVLAAWGARAEGFVFGADMSSVNERLACGATFRDGGRAEHPDAMLHRHGLNLVRLRLWNNPSGWTDFSNLQDVERSIADAHVQGLKVLLDFHYSDRWADAKTQIVPDFWRDTPTDAALAKKLHDYTGLVLLALNQAGLGPDMVQIGNETNSELMVKTPWTPGRTIDWRRNALLFNAAIAGVHDVDARLTIKPRIILHIAQPENAMAWFTAATAAGVRGYDIIGLSYYPKWSREDLAQLGDSISALQARFGKQVMIVETAYPATLANGGFPAPDPDQGETKTAAQTLLPGFPATPAGQNAFLIALTRTVMRHGGIGVIDWEPARVDVRCWGRARSDGNTGWQNATWFDRSGGLYPGLTWMQHDYSARNEHG